MAETTTIFCHECDSAHECEICYDVDGEPYPDVPVTCCNCGEELVYSGDSDRSLRNHERKQMGC